jgi:ferritin-like metal-binding protein YciE
MTEIEIKIIEKKAQIKILDCVLNSLCVGELSQKGRQSILGMMSKLGEEINDIFKGEGVKTDNQTDNYSNKIN